MRTSLAVVTSLLGLASALPADGDIIDKRQSVPTIYLCGDSTMAKGGGGSGTEGWGPYLQYSFDSSRAKVDNRAIGGRSARSYTREGRFDDVAGLVKAGDWVVMEFGHNDGGSLTPTDNGRTDCFGDGAQTCQTTYNGVAETVLTYPAYLKNAAQKFNAAGAKVIISSATPNNVWESGTYGWGYDRFFHYAWLAVEQLGGPSKGYYFVPHGEYAAQAMKNLGASIVNANYPNGHTHTAPFLADAMHKAFVLGLRCGTSALASLAKNTTASLTSTYLGPCVDNYNSTVHALLR
ncbi:GDSL-like Lipase/Acylhydrolase [Colletotrichum graminicola]|uniref:GDSL-like Lipase/Acylhydrolase n=1 Tax=Colletotrichum graminicola (strain M1.001 / M2 / FGSC 10212) TaxID=645133 RepID=E3QNS7_COLGM|nr:GDSL-like Lipase/Acylhydrolase [Colletotrichum graminicola M1.001]EFQ32434.1 GDSL-like Lipase/Acylhydrolase [Colletotrichum graminicola M1.001]WDK14575.1 GDSL-like Lipase/Acylhydrolase [Colletotrichum graminicola]